MNPPCMTRRVSGYPNGVFRPEGGAFMEDDPISLSGDLSGDVRVFRDRFRASDNADIIIRRFRSGAFFSALVTIDGMTDTRESAPRLLAAIDAEYPETL